VRDRSIKTKLVKRQQPRMRRQLCPRCKGRRTEHTMDSGDFSQLYVTEKTCGMCFGKGNIQTY